MKSVALAVLGAGASQRFGSENKLLAQWRGKPLIAHVLETFDAAAFARCILVLRKGDHALAEIGRQHAFETFENMNAKNGIAGSIALAAQESKKSDGLMIALADMPLIKQATIDALLSAFQGAPNDAIIAPELNRHRGHPVIFARRYFFELAKLSGDNGAASVIKNHAHSYIGVPVDDEGVTIDFDTPAEFKRS